MRNKFGGLAQLARAFAWHAKGHRFDSGNLHNQPGLNRAFFMNKFYTYIIYSPSLDQYYIGHTENVENRLFRHNNSGSKFTKKTNDWVVKYTEEFSTKAEAATRELEIKKKKSRKYIQWLISSAG